MAGSTERPGTYAPLSPEERQQALAIAQDIKGVAEDLSEGKDISFRTYPDGRAIILKKKPAIEAEIFQGADLLIEAYSSQRAGSRTHYWDENVVLYPDHSDIVRRYTRSASLGRAISLNPLRDLYQFKDSSYIEDMRDSQEEATPKALQEVLENLRLSTPRTV